MKKSPLPILAFASSVRFPFLLGIILLIPGLISCSVLADLSAHRAEILPGEMLYEDDFSDLGSGWRTWYEENGSLIDYQNGGFRFVVNQPDHDYWSVQKMDFQDVRLEVEAIKINGPDDNHFGVICRYQDTGNFYAFLLTSDGYYGILKMQENEYHLLSGESLLFDDGIRQGRAINQIRADCIGDQLTLYANEIPLVTVQDAAFQEGQVGLLAGAYESAGVDILFDQFKVIQP